MTPTNYISEKEQTGGWYNIQIATIQEIIQSPDILTNDNANQIVIDSLWNNLDILPFAENIKITETLRKTKSGVVYNIKGDFQISYHKKTIDTFFNKWINSKVVMIGIKHFGQRKMYGSKLFPLEFSYQFINGKKYEDGSILKITVSGKIPQKPVFINDF